MRLVNILILFASTSSIATIVDTLIGEFAGVQESSNLVKLQFKNHQLPLVIQQENSRQINSPMLLKIKDKESDKACFEMKINMMEKTAELENITVNNLKCPGPTERKGSFYLEFADTLSAKLNLSKVELIDLSTVDCPLNEEEASLRLLRIMEKGKGWYEEYGFLPAKISYEKFREDVNSARNFSLERLLANAFVILKTDFSALKEELVQKQQKHMITTYPQLVNPSAKGNFLLSDHTIRKFNDIQKTYDAFFDAIPITTTTLIKRLQEFKSKYQSDLLHEFMTWLWKADCKDYIVMQDFLFPNKLLTHAIDIGLGTFGLMSLDEVDMVKHFNNQ